MSRMKTSLSLRTSLFLWPAGPVLANLFEAFDRPASWLLFEAFGHQGTVKPSCPNFTYLAKVSLRPNIFAFEADLSAVLRHIISTANRVGKSPLGRMGL